jgi:hypothetical protein
MKFLLSLTAFVILIVLGTTNVQGQEFSPPPQMEVLERLVGTWDTEQTTTVPTEIDSEKLVVKRELVLGGRFVRETGGFDDNGEPSFTGMYTYDAQKQVYRNWHFFSSGFYWESTGTWDESKQTLTLTYQLPGDGKGVATMRLKDEETLEFLLIGRDASGTVSYHLEGKAVRQE